MEITYYGHSCFGIATKKANLLIDPFITGNDLAKNKIDIKDIEADYILLTHAHQDHVLDAEAIAKRTGAKIICNFEMSSHYGDKGLDALPMNHGGTRKFDFGLVKMVNAVHTSGFADGSYGGQPAGFVIQADGKTIYHAGDTALTMDMKLIPMQFDLDLAILPLGDTVTMGLADAVRACDFLECSTVLGCHYDTFDFIKMDKSQAHDAFNRIDRRLLLLDIGEMHDLS